MGWASALSGPAKHVQKQAEQCLAAYRAKPNLIEQDAGIELSNIKGAYGRKQLNELVQNAADALLDNGGAIALVLSGGVLYAANEGRPFSESGIETLMASHLSRKRDEEIGRFGLGFKSVLGITDKPEIFSQTVSVRFDRMESERLCREIDPNAPRTPVLRIGFSLDPLTEAESDPVLKSLMEWATTIVRLPLKQGSEWLGEELLKFPPEFLLFADHVNKLILRDDDAGAVISWETERTGDQILLRSDKDTSSWNVFKVEHRPSGKAKDDAGTISGRDKIEVAWAVPLKGRNKAGKFWSNFPTRSGTTLSGIINTAFKTNEDRHDILDGVYNREILVDVLPELVAANLPKLIDPEDPASILEILPGRGREERSWADDVINEPIMKAVTRVASLPDMDGHLRVPAQVKLHPGFLAEFNSWIQAWAAVDGRPSDWVHPSVDKTDERRAKAVRLMNLANATPKNVGDWLHELAKYGGVAGSQEAIKLAAKIDQHAANHMMEIRQAEFVLAADGKLKCPVSGKIFLAESASETDGSFVHPEVIQDQAVVSALSALSIGRLDQKGRLRAQVHAMAGKTATRTGAEKLWELTRGLAVADAATILLNAFGPGNTPVITMAGEAATISNTLLPGVIVPADGSRDLAVATDTRFHRPDLELLRKLGALSEPQIGLPSVDENWYQTWIKAAHKAYAAWIGGKGGKFQQSKVRIIEGRTLKGLDVLVVLSPEGKSAVTQQVLASEHAPWLIDQTSSDPEYRMSFTNPALWLVSRIGMVNTAYGLLPVSEAFGRVSGIPDNLIPVARIPEDQQKALGLKSSLDADDWTALLRQPWKHLDQAQLGEFYGYAASLSAPRPEDLGVQIGLKKTVTYPDETYVTADESAYELGAAAHPMILVRSPDHAEALIANWGLLDASDVVNRAVLAAVSGESVPLSERFPGLRVHAEVVPNLELVPCSDLSTEVTTAGAPGPVVSDHEILRDGESRVYFRDHLTDEALLAAVNGELRLKLDSETRRRILSISIRSEAKKLSAKVKSESDQDKKLLLLAGVDALKGELPPGAVNLAEQRRGRKLEDTEIAAMARMTKGAALVERLRPAIENRGLELPILSGGSQARAKIRELGLSEEFAGSRVRTREPRFEVLGPITLPDLHPYQEKVVENLQKVLRPGGKNRGLVALPTGSGKTRVAVEALIRYSHFADSEPLILWIAQSDELCEQAVEAWRYAWSAIAPSGEKLTVSRLWGANDATPADDGVHLVVATDDKLASLSLKGQHEWLTEADVVLVDEAHTSISPTYTKLFEWLKRGVKQRDRILLGLSATPYRGNNEAQTKTLVNRYDSNLLTDGILGEDPYRELQKEGILARVRHEELDGMLLKPSKSAKRNDPDAVHFDDYRIDLNEVAGDPHRNKQILDHLESLPSDMTALVFAASVPHAEILAAVLAGSGIPAASIDAYTPARERRRLIERFRIGDVRVLTNYNVLSQGFDAPKVGAVYVTRPTFSPNRYQQMIGRGLRGPKNGGSKEVLIVNVRDNIQAFGTELAFTHFDKLWTEAR